MTRPKKETQRKSSRLEQAARKEAKWVYDAIGYEYGPRFFDETVKSLVRFAETYGRKERAKARQEAFRDAAGIVSCGFEQISGAQCEECDAIRTSLLSLTKKPKAKR